MDDIINDMKHMIYDLKRMESSIHSDRKDTIRALSNGSEAGIWEKTAKTYENGLIEAQDALQRAAESIRLIQECLDTLIENIEYATLSNATQGK